MAHSLDLLPRQNLGALLVRALDRYKTIFEAPIDSPDADKEGIRWTIGLVEGFQRAVVNLAHDRPIRDDLRRVDDVAGSVWVIVGGKLWYDAACQVCEVARGMLLKIYTIEGQPASSVNFAPMLDRDGETQSDIYGYIDDDNIIRQQFISAISGLVTALSEYDKNSDLALLMDQDCKELEDPKVANDYLIAKLNDVSGSRPLKQLWPDAVPHWILDPDNYD